MIYNIFVPLSTFGGLPNATNNIGKVLNQISDDFALVGRRPTYVLNMRKVAHVSVQTNPV